MEKQVVLPQIDKIKTFVKGRAQLDAMLTKCLFRIGVKHYGVCSYSKIDWDRVEKHGIFIAFSTSVYAANFEQYELHFYDVALGIPIEVSNDMFIDILDDTLELLEGRGFNWVNLYGYYLFPNVHKRQFIEN